MRDAPVQNIAPPAREEALMPARPKRPQPQKRRFGTMLLGLSIGLGLGLAGGLTLPQFVDLNHGAAWVQQTKTFVQSAFDAARNEVVSRIDGLTRHPASVAVVAEPTPWTTPSSNEAVVQRLGDLSRQVDQVRAGFEVSARDVAQAVERIRGSAEDRQRELVAKLAQLTERVERVERRSIPTATPVKPQPIVQPTPAAPTKLVAKPVRKPASESRMKIAARQTLPEAKPRSDAKGIANWSVREVFDDTAVLDGPSGVIAVGPGDSIPGLGQIQAIRRSGGRWVVATTKGVIRSRKREPVPEEASVNAW